MAFLKALWRAGSKHKKLNDEWDLTPKNELELELEQPGSTLEGITFIVKYLGTTGISTPSNSKATAEAVRTIMSLAKGSNKKSKSVQLAVNLRGVSVTDVDTKEPILDISLYRISYCSADATYGHVFAFIATNDDDSFICHAFLCPKRKMAQLMSITVAQTFNTAFHLWQMTHTNIKPNGPKPSDFLPGIISSQSDDKKPNKVLQSVLSPIPMLIDLTTPIEPQHKQWTSFDD